MRSNNELIDIFIPWPTVVVDNIIGVLLTNDIHIMRVPCLDLPPGDALYICIDGAYP